jgi:Ran GTPase-activating protein (RanGAP) involved in mRNA processing and transport
MKFLKGFNLSNNNLDDTFNPLFEKILAIKRISRLDLSKNCLGNQFAHMLCRILK